MSKRKPPPSVRNVVSEADRATLEERYEFVPSGTQSSEDWQGRMLERYQQGLYREFALADLSRAPQLGLRWRTQREVVEGRGERTCGNLHCESHDRSLTTVEVPFAYKEQGIQKKELVKLRLCCNCSPLLRKEEKKENDNVKPRNEATEDSASNSSSSSSTSSRKERRRRKERKRRRKEKRKQKKQKRRKANNEDAEPT